MNSEISTNAALSMFSIEPANVGRCEDRMLRGAKFALAIGVIGCSLLGLLGCSVSTQDEYYRIRSIVLVPEPGDGSTLTAVGPRFSGIDSTSTPALALGHAPGTASDQIAEAQ